MQFQPTFWDRLRRAFKGKTWWHIPFALALFFFALAPEFGWVAAGKAALAFGGVVGVACLGTAAVMSVLFMLFVVVQMFAKHPESPREGEW